MEGPVQNGEGSTRWTPTSEQIEMLKQLYYGSGIRSPTAEQIRTISARLRQLGRIEGKNVFYWFQNHRARERQKSRLRHLPLQLQSPSSTMETSFTECAICCYPSQSFQWTSGVNPCNPESYTNTGNYSSAAAADDDVYESSAELETLPLFPTHAEEASSATTGLCGTTLRPQPAAATSHNYSYYTATTSAAAAVSTLTSLELSLSSTPTMNGQI